MSNASTIASKVTSVNQLWRVLAVLNPMDRKQTLILEELENQGKGQIVKDYTKRWESVYGE